MRKRDFYKFLGVPVRADPAEIERAYRQMVFVVHPDYGDRPDAERFGEVQEAYKTLGDPGRRRAYDIDLITNRRPLSAELSRWALPVIIPDDFLTVKPSTEELLDHIAQCTLGSRRKSGGPHRRLSIETVVQSEDARFGCRVPLRIYFYNPCQECGGTSVPWGLCAFCDGSGMIKHAKQIILRIVPGARGCARYEVSLGEVGIGNLLVEAMIILH